MILISKGLSGFIHLGSEKDTSKIIKKLSS